MKIFKKPFEVMAWRQKIKDVGFVPTMGGLHEGHLSLIKKAKRENALTLVSIFLNPTQFDNQNDFKTYPKDLASDLNLLEKISVDAVFSPCDKDIYGDNFQYMVNENHLSHQLCGKSRKGHFKGVLTVVLKLFNIVQPDRAYFGEKDYQQLDLVKGLVKAFFLNVEIVGCPTVREDSGLAWSSRNQKLSKKGRKQAGKFFKILSSSLKREKMIQHLNEKNFKVEYIEEKTGRRYGAVFYEGVRLIDNVKI